MVRSRLPAPRLAQRDPAALMGKRAFWPGFSWRILAHERTARGAAKTEVYTGKRLDIRSGPRWKPQHYEGETQFMEGHWEFDEVVIDSWLHLEQMDDRDWWLSVGNPEGREVVIDVHIDRDGKATATVRDY